jgi:UDP-N-acetylmuramyl pentapeptide phosphotransferase/UDP-N-acetylglucosamine-1-phosphate transferase
LNTLHSLLHYGFVCIILLCVEYFYIRFANWAGIVDTPNERSSHGYIPARGGGVIFPIVMLFWVITSGAQDYFFLAGLILLSVISYIDDIKPQHFAIKLIVQAVSVMLLLFGIFGDDSSLLYLVIYFIAMLYFINVYNFMDGINGITGCYSLVAIFSWMFLAGNISRNQELTHAAGYLTVAILVFLIFNFRKRALSFAGDVGSMSIAYIFLFLYSGDITIGNILQFIVFFSVYFADTITTIIQRLLQGENIFNAHRKHLYQLLSNELSIDHRLVSVLFMVLQLLINWVYTYYNSGPMFAVVLFFAPLVLFGLFKYLLLKKIQTTLV